MRQICERYGSGAAVGSIQGIRISDVVAHVTLSSRSGGADRRVAQAGPIMIAGIPGHDVEDVLLENITVSYPGGIKEKIERVVPEDETRYPEQFFFGILPAWGAYIRHARNIEFKNVHMTVREPDARERIVLDDVRSFEDTK